MVRASDGLGPWASSQLQLLSPPWASPCPLAGLSFPGVIRPLDAGIPHTPKDTDILSPQAHHPLNSTPLLSLQHVKSEILPMLSESPGFRTKDSHSK